MTLDIRRVLKIIVHRHRKEVSQYQQVFAEAGFDELRRIREKIRNENKRNLHNQLYR